MKEWEIKQIKRAIHSCENKRKSHYENTPHKASNAIRNEDTKIKALKKQLPKKPVLDAVFPSGVKWYFCPTCKHIITEQTDKYCRNCGQALDWSDNE